MALNMSAEKWILFHQIGSGGEDSARVRKYLVEHQLTEHIQFLNIAYEGAQGKLRALIGAVETPVLIVGQQILRGSVPILQFLEKI